MPFLSLAAGLPDSPSLGNNICFSVLTWEVTMALYIKSVAQGSMCGQGSINIQPDRRHKCSSCLSLPPNFSFSIFYHPRYLKYSERFLAFNIIKTLKVSLYDTTTCFFFHKHHQSCHPFSKIIYNPLLPFITFKMKYKFSLIFKIIHKKIFF